MKDNTILLDCTFRDGGYYNAWDFPTEVINQYLVAMKAAQVDVVELGFRFIANSGFKGPCAYTTDDFLRGLNIPDGLTIAVMLNGGDLLTDLGLEPTLERLFPEAAADTPVDLVRFACHFHEFEQVLPAVNWLNQRGYRVGFNLMQIADRSREEILQLARHAKECPIEVLYFADSMGSMTPDDTVKIIDWLREEWDGPIGIHTHDNMGLALQNTLQAQAAGATWLDATVTGMGRGPGNARTEELVIEAADLRGSAPNLVPLMSLIRSYFQPMKNEFGWGTNPYYYMSGKYGIHPTYIQEMLGDTRYSEEDIIAVIKYLHDAGGKSYSSGKLNGARDFFLGPPKGEWNPADMLKGRDVLILGAGPSIGRHRIALEAFIKKSRPVVVALNTQCGIASDLIDLRAACHPVRLLADSETHTRLPQPLVTPASMLPNNIRTALGTKSIMDFGLGIEPNTFSFNATSCIAPNSLVLSYALALAASGKANRILLAGFDGYVPGDPRNGEMDQIFNLFTESSAVEEIVSITPTIYGISKRSVYGWVS
jgi:4-hydroxy 2-oxovalerate aldolase